MKNKNLYIRVLSWYQMLGGIIGVFLIIWILISVHLLFVEQYFLIIFVALLYLFSILCGLLLLKNEKKGLKISVVNQILQIISFSILGYAFKYISGLYISFGVDLTNFSVGLYFGTSSWQLLINMETTTCELYINIIPLFLLNYIFKLKKQNSNDEDSFIEVKINN